MKSSAFNAMAKRKKKMWVIIRPDRTLPLSPREIYMTYKRYDNKSNNNKSSIRNSEKKNAPKILSFSDFVMFYGG